MKNTVLSMVGNKLISSGIRRLRLPSISKQGLEEAAGSGAVSVLNFVS